MLSLESGQIKRLERSLGRFADKAFPFATKSTLNSAAFNARGYWQENISNDLVNRNKFTRNSIRVEQTRTLVVRRQEAIVGSIAPYMDRQEFGGAVPSEGKEGHPIATGFAAGQRGKVPRTRLPRKPNTRKNIRLRNGTGKGKTRAQRNLIAVREAAGSGNKYVFLDTGRRQGIYKIVGGKRAAQPRLVWDMSRPSVPTPKTPTLAPAFARATADIPQLYLKALKFQRRRLRLF